MTDLVNFKYSNLVNIWSVTAGVETQTLCSFNVSFENIPKHKQVSETVQTE